MPATAPTTRWPRASSPRFTAELVGARSWPTQAAWQAIREWLEVWYNHQRRHSALGYRSPVACEEVLLQQTSAA